jgi:hypothetical protein
MRPGVFARNLPLPADSFQQALHYSKYNILSIITENSISLL